MDLCLRYSQIFGHLKPLDLLHLARTTKDLRAILMARSSTSIWKHARSQFDDLPDCPDDLSEPRYAELLFGKACTVSLIFIFFTQSHSDNPFYSIATGILCPTLSFGHLELEAAPDACQNSTMLSLCPHFKRLYHIISFSPFIYQAAYPRYLLEYVQVITWVKSSKLEDITYSTVFIFK